MNIIISHKKIIVAVLLVLVILILLVNNINIGNGSEKTAQQFVEYMLCGNARKCTSLMHNDLIDVASYETKKLFINAFDKSLDSIIDEYKDTYGRNWRYDVVVIDSFSVDVYDAFDYTPEYAEEGTFIKVVLEIKHSGGGLFNNKEGSDEVSLIMIHCDGKWLVYDFPF